MNTMSASFEVTGKDCAELEARAWDVLARLYGTGLEQAQRDWRIALDVTPGQFTAENVHPSTWTASVSAEQL